MTKIRQRPDVPEGLDHLRDMHALLIALETGDERTAELIRDTGDHWRMLGWAIAALCGELNQQPGRSAIKYARDMIARTIADEASRGQDGR